MQTALLIVQCLLGLIFVITGSFKLFQSKEKVVESGGTWAENFNPGIIKLIAAAELICGLVVPLARFIGYGAYSFVGAAGIALIMAGSIFVHIRRKEYKHAAINTVFLLMALFVVCYGRQV